ncbi:bifunctional indole-3-glycerol-phosphate synthase TrpC/phosphoribosylanthranilate isomerase TrpF [Buchnera aphidicola]|uniref:bifunctional indole-3-glycerol-phosphate synthase TrpC/phosphoribosylanthranilate isomerase TrpF n=1 Tax=Buchnera aphidicola TaxID=9 RepID=UPI00346425DB
MQETILNKIIKDKIDWIKYRKKKQPLNIFKQKINKETRDFYKSLQKKSPFFILECKKSSPSLGIIRKDFNLIHIANIYKKYATSISVLTEEKYFHGKMEYIDIVRKCVSQPILCKDFFIDPYQIYLARYYNADAILLMLSVLNNVQYIALSKIAKKLRMGILTEVNNIEEVKRAIELKSSVIGINNRNLHDLSIDLNRTRNLSSLIKDRIIISESGIKNNRQIKELSTIVNGFLIGSSLMSKKDLETNVKSLIIGDNKVCGLTRIIDAKIAEKSGAVYGGLIFVKKSSRKITPKIAQNIIFQNKLRFVGIFQNQDIETIIEITKKISLHAIQLHGSENQNYINILREKLSKKIKIWKAFSIQSKIPLLNWHNVNKYILDSSSGGSNTSFNWNLLKGRVLDHVLLAGGININNCLIASRLNCSGLDLNSGVEKSPGIKDHKKIKSIFKKIIF